LPQDLTNCHNKPLNELDIFLHCAEDSVYY